MKEIERAILAIAEQRSADGHQTVAMQRLFAERGRPAWEAALRMTQGPDTREATAVLRVLRAASLMAPCGGGVWCAGFGIVVSFARFSQPDRAGAWVPGVAPVRRELLGAAVGSLAGVDGMRTDCIPVMIPAKGLAEGHAPWTPAEARALGNWVQQGEMVGRWPGWQTIVDASKRADAPTLRRSEGERVLVVDPRFVPVVLQGAPDRLLALGEAFPGMQTDAAEAVRRSIELDYEVTRLDLPVMLAAQAAPLRDTAGVVAHVLKEVEEWGRR